VRKRLTIFRGPTDNILLESTVHWLSENTVKFEVDVEIHEKFAKM